MDAIAVVDSGTFIPTSVPIQFAAVTAFEDYTELDLHPLHSRRILNSLELAILDSQEQLVRILRERLLPENCNWV